MADELTIWLRGAPVAQLGRRGADLAITYDPKVVNDLGVGALCLSTALPVSAKPYGEKTVSMAKFQSPVVAMRSPRSSG